MPEEILIVEGAVAGVEEAAPGHSNVLVVGREIAERLLLWPWLIYSRSHLIINSPTPPQ